MMMDNNTVKRFKQSKDCEKSSLARNEQEVLVLPPNLLQELGINLGHIHKTPDCSIVKGNIEPGDLLKGEKSNIDFEQLDNVGKEVTANVMEKSVQLSEHILPSIHIPKHKQEHIFANNLAWTSKIEQNNINICLDQKMDKSTDIQMEFSLENSTDISGTHKNANEDNNKKMNCLNIGEFNALSSKSSHNSNNEKKSKINIISQEVVGVETFNKFKLFPTPKNALIPFKINTPLGKVHKTALTSDVISSKHLTHLEHKFEKIKKFKTKTLVCDKDMKDDNFIHQNANILDTNYSDINAVTSETSERDFNKALDCSDTNSVIIGVSQAGEKTEIYCAIDVNTEESNPSMCNKNKIIKLPIDLGKSVKIPTPSYSLVSQISVNNTGSNIHDIEKKELDRDIEICREKNNNRPDNLEESNITVWEQQYMGIIKHNSVSKNADYMNQCLLEKVNLSQHLTTKSKLCIQGVEKPGGLIESDIFQNMAMPLKTYQNRKGKDERCRKYTNVEILTNELSAKNSDINCAHVNNLNLTCVPEQFCTCNDYGRLQFYDSESKYQHIHFWTKKAAQSSTKTMFEIGNDEYGSNEGIFAETDNNYANIDFEYFNELSNICCMQYSISESNIFEQFNENKTTLSHDINVNNKIMNLNNINSIDDVKSYGTYSSFPGIKVEVESVDEGNLSEQVIPNKIFEESLAETAKNQYGRVSSVEEGGENSEIHKSKKRKRTSQEEEEEGTSWKSTSNYHSARHSKKIISSIKCAVCFKELPEVDWESHLSENHCYIAWKDGCNIDLNDEKLLQNLTKILKKGKALECTFCGKKEKNLKKFMSHLKICITKIFKNVNIDLSEEDVKNENDDTIKCEMCAEAVLASLWTEHMTTMHNRSPQTLPAQIKNVIERSMESGHAVDEKEICPKLVKCAVCKMEMETVDWIDHIRKNHNYLAWKDGDPVLDLDDEKEIQNYLQDLIKEIGGLVCTKCGLIRHYAKRFMIHIKICNGNMVNHNDSLISNQSNNNVIQTDDDDNKSLIHAGAVECGVCLQKVVGTDWLDHIHREHNYLAKIRGVPQLDLDDEEAVRKHLLQVRLITGYLVCAKCGIKRKFIKTFLEHIKDCDGTTKAITKPNKNLDLDDTKDISIAEEIILHFSGTVKCGVCNEDVDGEHWLEHIQKEHAYIAWIDGMPPLNLQTDEEIWQYLNNVTKKIGGLICAKCGLNRKYGKAYMQHVKECDGSKANLSDQLNDTQIMENNLNSTYFDDSILYSADQVKCGVCAVEMDGEHWLRHIQKEHDYIAWMEGQPPLNQNDRELINTYLKVFIRRIGGLTCGKCGLVRKVAKAYLQHVRNCDETKVEAEAGTQDNVNEDENEFVHTGKVKCGVCSQLVEGRQWIVHIRLKHDYLARIEGKPPLDINNEAEVRKHLSALRKCVNELICNNCGESRKFVKAYMKHVKNCDDSEKQSDGSDLENEEEEAFIPMGTVQCGVCKQEVNGEEWINHIHKEHDYLAWIGGRPPLNIDDEYEVKTHLKNVRQHIGQLVCNKCGQARKFVKSFMRHVRNCDGSKPVVESRRASITSEPTEEEEDIQLEFNGPVVCGVCEREVDGAQWVHHIRTEHDYIAHVKGKKPLDINNTKQIQKHLYAINKHAGGLFCNTCGIMRLYVKSYLVHVRQCKNTVSPLTVVTIDQEIKKESDESFTLNDTTVKSTDKSHDIDVSQFVYEGTAVCGVCQNKVEGDDWIDHIQKKHNYLAWTEGQPPLDLDNQEQVQAHLYGLSKLQNGLKCKTCGAKRKYVKLFLDHIQNCTITLGDVSEGNLLECAICSEKVPVQGWKNHAMDSHYNIAWAVGSEPIDLKNPYAVEKYLKEYKQDYKTLVCKICKITRVSCAGFYAHIITCGKTDEEIEDYKSFCDICKSKYLCIYKNQHLAMHREQEYAKQKKNKALELAQSKVDETHGRRRAAEKAKTVIEDYKSNLNDFNHKCPSCSFGTDVEEELEGHTCEGGSDQLSDSDASIQSGAQSEEESDSDVDSDVSLEEAEKQAADKKRRYVDTSGKVSRIPFKINSASNYVSQAAVDFYNKHYTLEELFPDWKPRDYQEVDAEDLSKYLPTLEESCKVKVGNGEWTTYKRFEAKKEKVASIFVGGSIRCVSWAPVRCGDDMADAMRACGSYLAVAGHGASDAPRLPASQLSEHPALLQLWDFADFNRVPKFALGLAHDYGTVWAMEWCPSGARDCPPPDTGLAVSSRAKARLGLLAVACSNGSAYIFAVPYPTYDAQKPQILKIKPSVELKLCSSRDRRNYQATAICWSKQKGHTIILVGYADGSMAFYNLDCDSPFLKSEEDGVTILYPFQDDRPHNTCISDVGLFPSDNTDSPWGASSGASCTGVHAALRAPAPRLHAPPATAAALFTPHWPSLIVTADEALANHMTNELEWQGGGRRLGGQRAIAACDRCGAAAVLTPPALRLLRIHPAYRDPRRDVVGLLRMAPLARKRSKHKNDELSMKVEPLTYEDAIKEFGIELKLKSHINKVDQQMLLNEAKQQFPERFPLAEVPGMAFCSAPAAHGKLALPTHSGVLFIVTV